VKFSIKALRALSPCTEKSRMEFRRALAETEAHAADLTRSIDKDFYGMVNSLRKAIGGKDRRRDDK